MASELRHIDPADLDLSALRSPPDAHKGTRGALGILGGAPGMLGAAWLAGRAALHAGAGRVYVGQIDPAAPAVDPLYPELMLRRAEDLLLGWEPSVVRDSAARTTPPTPADGDRPPRLPLTAVVAGPGMATVPPAADLLASVLDAPLPVLLDADALNLLAGRADLRHRLLQRDAAAGHASLITPHAGEAARLLGVSPEAIQADRPASALALSRRYRSTVVLKGSGTLVAWIPGVGGEGGEPRLARNPTGGVRLATAGTGDVLSGLLGALLARGMPVADAARLGVWLHGRAGDSLAAERPTASGLLGPISVAIDSICAPRSGGTVD